MRKKKTLPVDRIIMILQGLCSPVRELYVGAKVGSIPTGNCLALGILWTFSINIGLDHWLWSLLKLGHLYPEHIYPYLAYYYFALFSGFIGWGIWQSVLRKQLVERLTEVFISAGLKSPMGRLPGFLYDRPIDEDSRLMCLTKHSIPKAKFEEAKQTIESGLQIYIDEFKDNIEDGTIQISYSHKAMPALVISKDLDRQRPLTFPVGETRSKIVTGSLKETPHMLVGGTSGYGKSTFLRQVITSLYLNNEDIEFYLFDFKFGMEFQLFDNLPRIKVIDNITDGVNYLNELDPGLDFRGNLMRKLGCNEFSQIQTKTNEEIKRLGFDPEEVKELKREVIVVDEIAEITLSGGDNSSQDIQDARKVLNRIARLGRAGGIHLILATQRPDVKAIDGQIKANLPARLAFYMSDQASSKTILDRARAADLPQIKGRAVWKDGDYREVQTAYLSEDAVREIFKDKYRKPKPETRSDKEQATGESDIDLQANPKQEIAEGSQNAEK
jgi:hypothetical protein